MTDPEDCDGWTQQVVDRNKKCCGAKKSGFLFELQKASMRRIKEFANIEKVEVTQIMLLETTARTTEIIYAGWLDDVARRTPEDTAADRSSKDATIKTLRIEKERHCTARVVRRSMTAWNEHGTDNCWEEVTSILTGELDIGVPTTFVSENHGCVIVHRGINFPSCGSDAESNETGCVPVTHFDTKTMP